MTRPILVTGAAGFIGAAVVHRLLERGERVVGVDDLNPYYDPSLKRARLAAIAEQGAATHWCFHPLSISDGAALAALFAAAEPRAVIHLAAQAGVRHSITHPGIYIQSNLVGFGHVLECCRNHGVVHLVYASSSSVYGGNRTIPFRESQPVNHPVSLYAATKRANELMAHAYSHLFGLAATGLRFFTVYGPWGRPDMAPMLFASSILAGEPIRVYNHGAMNRDFTYIDDVVEALIRCLDKPATPDPDFDRSHPDPATSWTPHRLFNIGNSQPVALMEFITHLERALGRQAIKDFQPMQPGDVESTAADSSALADWIDFRPMMPIGEGVSRFAVWYRQYTGS